MFRLGGLVHFLFCTNLLIDFVLKKKNLFLDEGGGGVKKITDFGYNIISNLFKIHLNLQEKKILSMNYGTRNSVKIYRVVYITQEERIPQNIAP